jgi:hypothetical protein
MLIKSKDYIIIVIEKIIISIINLLSKVEIEVGVIVKIIINKE